MNYKPVEVIWDDAWSDSEQRDIEAIGDIVPVERRDVGYLIKSDKSQIIITSGVLTNLYEGKIFIDGVKVFPRSIVRKVRGIDGN